MSNNLVMAVDDSKTMRDMVSFTMKDLGFDVVTACDGREALNYLKNTKVRLVITDLNMPVMDGLGLIGEVRSDSVNSATPILMLTTEADKEKVSKARELGATGWVVKPFSPDKLKNVVKKVCG